MIKKVFLVSDNILNQREIYKNLHDHIKIHYKIEVQELHYKISIEDPSHTSLYFLYLDDTTIKEFFKNNLNNSLKLAIIPNEHCPRVLKSYGIAKDISEAIDDGFNEQNLSTIDLLVCNGRPTFTNIVVGDVHGLNQSSFEQKVFSIN